MTKDEDKSKAQLIKELGELRKRTEKLESSEVQFHRTTGTLEEGENLYRILAESAQDLIFAIDKEGSVKYVNSYAARCLGSSPDAVIGRHLSVMFPPGAYEMQKAGMQRVFKSGDPYYFEEEFSFAGRQIWLDTRLIPIKGRSGEVKYVLGISRDTTERKKMESEIHKTQRLESVGILAGGIAHEFNNILTAINGNIILAKMYAKPGLEVFDILVEAEKACKRAEDLTRQLLTFSKGGTSFKKKISLRQMIIDLVGSASVGSNISCVFDLPPNLWAIEGDEGQIRQAIGNLVVNAREAMPMGGTIRIRAENVTVDPESESLPSLKEGAYVKISVEDPGVGIEEAHLPKIFDPFYTTKEKGSGLGLASTFSIVKSHHGNIAVESKVGSGTTFHIFLPAFFGTATESSSEGRVTLVDRRKVLVMDDEEMIRNVVERMLDQCGCEATFARDGNEMLNAYRKAMESGRPFDAVIVDLIIPWGMGGKEAMEKLLQIDPHARAIVSSGYSDDPIMADYKKFGFSGVLAKPYQISGLSNALREVISGSGT